LCCLAETTTRLPKLSSTPAEELRQGEYFSYTEGSSDSDSDFKGLDIPEPQDSDEEERYGAWASEVHDEVLDNFVYNNQVREQLKITEIKDSDSAPEK
jgi:hypothetical protein